MSLKHWSQLINQITEDEGPTLLKFGMRILLLHFLFQHLGDCLLRYQFLIKDIFNSHHHCSQYYNHSFIAISIHFPSFDGEKFQLEVTMQVPAGIQKQMVWVIIPAIWKLERHSLVQNFNLPVNTATQSFYQDPLPQEGSRNICTTSQLSFSCAGFKGFPWACPWCPLGVPKVTLAPH